MRRERNTHTTTSKYGVPYKQPRKPLMSAEARKRQAKSLITYKPGGDDIA